MEQEKFGDLATITTEIRNLDVITKEGVIDRFVKLKPRRFFFFFFSYATTLENRKTFGREEERKACWNIDAMMRRVKMRIKEKILFSYDSQTIIF